MPAVFSPSRLTVASIARGLVPQRLQQPQHAVGARGGAEQHRTDQPFAQLLGEIVEHLVARRGDILEQLLHQLVVMVGQCLQHGEARGLFAREHLVIERDDLGRRVFLVDEGALQREIDEAVDALAGEGRQLAQQQLAARGRLQQRQHVVDGRGGLVDLVEKEEVRNLLLFQFAQNDLQLRNFLFVHFANHDGGVDAGQRGAHVMRKFDRTGAIDESIAVAHEAGGGCGQLRAHAMIARLLAGIADRGAGFHLALALDGAGAREDRFKQRGLAALERAHQCDAPGTPGTCAVAVPCGHEHLPCCMAPAGGFRSDAGTASSQEARAIGKSPLVERIAAGRPPRGRSCAEKISSFSFLSALSSSRRQRAPDAIPRCSPWRRD